MRQIEIEKIQQQTEKMQLDLQQYKLNLIHNGKLSCTVSEESLSRSGHVTFDVRANLRLMPRFNERDPDTFFTLFERIAEVKNWPDADRTLMLQCVLTGRAQEKYSALSASECVSYAKVKSAVLKAYELVPKAYHQKFRKWEKSDKQILLAICSAISAAGVLLQILTVLKSVVSWWCWNNLETQFLNPLRRT